MDPPDKPIYGSRRTRSNKPDRKVLPLSPRGQDLVRNLIDSKRIVHRMQQFILGEADGNGQPVTMTRDQVSAAVALLRKTTPDQAAVVHSGDPANPISTSLTITFKRPEPSLTIDHAPETMLGEVSREPLPVEDSETASRFARDRDSP